MDTNGKVSQIEALLRQGITKKQLVAAGFPESTVRKAMKRLEKQGETPAGNHAPSAGNGIADNYSATDGAKSHFPTKLTTKEIIPPEALLSGIRLQEGDYKLGFVDGLRTLMATQWMVFQQVSILQGIAAAQSETMESQMKIHREAKVEGAELIEKAIQDAAIAVGVRVVEALKQQPSASVNPMQQLMVDMLRQPLSQLMTKVMGMFGQSMAGSIASAPAGVQPVAQNQTGVESYPSNLPQATEDELKEAFGE